jgi:RIO-like serine/threonine protein kinase
MEDFKSIIVTKGKRTVVIDNPTNFPLIGIGAQGAVYRISEEQCVKLYGNLKHAKREQKVLLSSQELPFIPKVYETGPNYIVMEYLSGPNLNMYLKKQSKLTEEITRRLLFILTAMKKSGFRQIDAPLRHIIVTSNGFKLVDHVYSYSREQDRPLELFKDLQERGFLDSFLKQVKAIDRKTYAAWTKKPIPLPNKGSK